MRATAIQSVIMFLGFEVIKTQFNKDEKVWQKDVTIPAMLIVAVAGITVAIIMIPTVVYTACAPLEFQPRFQLVLSVVTSIGICAYVYKRRSSKGDDLEKEQFSSLPLE